jgi:TnpA family transposase
VDRQHVNIQHILATLALKATRQSVIIAKLSSYPRKNRTKKALWELDNLRALNRGESYHKLVRAVAYANGGKLRVRTDQEQQLWSECSRLLANCIIYYNACILSELLERAERRQELTGRRDQASEPGKLEACKPLRGLQLPGYRRWGRPPGIGQSLGGSPR